MFHGTEMIAETAQRFAQLFREGRFAEVDSLDTEGLALAILNDSDLGASFCEAVARILSQDEETMRFVPHTHDGVRQVLGVPTDTVILTYAPHYAMGSSPLHEAGLQDMWNRTHYFRVQPDGIRYVGQVTYEQIRAITPGQSTDK